MLAIDPCIHHELFQRDSPGKVEVKVEVDVIERNHLRT